MRTFNYKRAYVKKHTKKNKNIRKTKKHRGGVKTKHATYKTTREYYKKNPRAPTATNEEPFYIFEKTIQPMKLDSTINTQHHDPHIEKLLQERKYKIKEKESSFRSKLPTWFPGSTKTNILNSKRKLVGTQTLTKMPLDLAKVTFPFLDNQHQFVIVFGVVPTEENGLYNDNNNKLNRIYKLSIQYVIQLCSSRPDITKFTQLLLFFERLLYNYNDHDTSKQISTKNFLDLAEYITNRLNHDKDALILIDSKNVLKHHVNIFIDNLYNFLRFYKYLRCSKNKNGEPIDSNGNIDSTIPIPIICEYRTRDDIVNTDEDNLTDASYDLIKIKNIPINRMLNSLLLNNYKIYQKMKTEGITPFFFWIANHYMRNGNSLDRYDFRIGKPEHDENTMVLEITEWEYDENFENPVDFLLDSSNPADIDDFQRRLLKIVKTDWSFEWRINGIDPIAYPDSAAVLQMAIQQFPEEFEVIN